MGLGAGGTSTNSTSNVSKIRNSESTAVNYNPTNATTFGKVVFNISDKNKLPVGNGGQPIGDAEEDKGKINKSKNYIFFVIAVLTLIFLLVKHKVI